MTESKTTIEICISGRAHGMRTWASVPRIGEDVYIKNMPDVSTERHGQFIEVGGSGYLKVCAVLWGEDRILVNLLGMKETP